MRRPLVIIESPYKGQVLENLRYARAAMVDCISRGETPLASHLLYTQDGILDDDDPRERSLGIEMGLQLYKVADKVAFYVDRGWSSGMKAARDFFAAMEMSPAKLEERTVPGWKSEETPRGATISAREALIRVALWQVAEASPEHEREEAMHLAQLGLGWPKKSVKTHRYFKGGKG